ncbi:anti-sigma-D factor RsdA [Saccharothrix australiensis]|uniref:anti-sigma-D factor RsdA n=1 Tax=Saccharothrix australiensis TaxID=2072 RepID=UPI001FE66AC3|nr:anti-sigma-D factor RsdA [Saccharothrix australiensis]
MEPGDDLAGIRADDALLDALGGRGGTDALVDDELNALLLAWRREVDSRPMGELVDTDTAVATIAAARPQPRRHRFLIPLASAAAVLAIAFTGVSLVARDARPGDTLWGLTRVLYSEHARSVEAAVTVRTDLETAGAALRAGRYGEARDLLNKAGEVLPSISVDDGKADLKQKHDSLVRELTSTTPAPSNTTAAHTPSPAPPLVPTRPSERPSASEPPAPTTTTTTTTPPTTTTTTVPTTDGTAVPPPVSGQPPAGEPRHSPGTNTGTNTEPTTN